MNDLNWRLDEIRRRSMVLERKRNRRRKRLLTLIPAALCAAICITVIASDLVNAPALAGEKPEFVKGNASSGQMGNDYDLVGGSGAAIRPPESAVEPGDGSGGNITVTLSVLQGGKFTLNGEASAQAVQLLESLNYDPMKLCDCVAPYRVHTESGTVYEIHPAEKYARCQKGQADLSEEQVEILTQLIDAAIKEG